MLSTLSSFLPSPLNPVLDKPIPSEPLPTPAAALPVHKPEQPVMAVDQHGVKKKKDKSNEAFILVRPPPSKTNHPLNLQVQLVPPHSRDTNRSASSRRSLDDNLSIEDSTNMEPLSRTESNRSEVSRYSSYSTSQTSISSVASTSSGRRMIIPLYNLQAHNVMTNVVVDAVTDARVAKFVKRGLEVLGVAVLEPMEVWGRAPGADLPKAAAGSVRNSYDEHEYPQQYTPGSSGISLPSTSHAHPPPTSTQTILAPPRPSNLLAPPPQQHTGAKRFFGKLFKKKDGLPSPVDQSVSISSRDSSPSRRGPADLIDRSTRQIKGNSLLVTGSNALDSPTGTLSVTGQPVILQPAVLGIQPTLNSITYPPQGRPTAYVWTVTRWLKGGSETLLGGVKGIFGNDRREGAAELETLVEVRCEWTRGKSGDKKRRRDNNGTDMAETVEKTRARRNSPIPTISRPPSTTSLNQARDEQQQRRARKRSVITGGRRSGESQRSISPKGGSIETITTASERLDDGEESDPEDSETPWTCNIIVRRIASPGAGSRMRHQRNLSTNSPGRDFLTTLPPPLPAQQQVKVKVATICPTPHHPKVVSLLKIPFPLPDIEVERVRLRKRIISPDGIARPFSISEPLSGSKPPGLSMFGNKDPARHVDEGLVLTAEEIKDVVTSTAFWLVVREGIGGVGKVSRKGDGWRLRG